MWLLVYIIQVTHAFFPPSPLCRMPAAHQMVFVSASCRASIFRGHYQPPLDAEHINAPYRHHRDPAAQFEPRGSHSVQVTQYPVTQHYITQLRANGHPLNWAAQETNVEKCLFLFGLNKRQLFMGEPGRFGMFDISLLKAESGPGRGNPPRKVRPLQTWSGSCDAGVKACLWTDWENPPQWRIQALI